MVLFNPCGYQSFNFDGAIAMCLDCERTWKIEANDDGSVSLGDYCPLCDEPKPIRVVEPGPGSIRG